MTASHQRGSTGPAEETKGTDEQERRGPAGKIATALAVVVVLGVIVWGATTLMGDDESGQAALPAGTDGPVTPWRPTGTAVSPGTSPTANAADRPVVLFDGPVTIHSGLGVDIDSAGPKLPAGKGSVALDVYWSQSAGLSVNDGQLYVDQGLPDGAAERCAARVQAAKDGYPSLDVFPGDQFCLRTSDGRIAWLRVGEGADKADELALQATVWDSIPG